MKTGLLHFSMPSVPIRSCGFFCTFFSKNDTPLICGEAAFVSIPTDSRPCPFTGKDPSKGWRTPLNYKQCSEQRDEETGYSYHGARYYDPSLSCLWLSVDPMVDKYQWISPYAYCAWNPVKLVDPDGKELWKPEILEDGTVNYIMEKGDDSKSLQKQYGLTEREANSLFSTMNNGKISGKMVETLTDRHCEILKYDMNYKTGNSMRDIRNQVYHAGFACLYNKVKQGGKSFKLNDFFTGLQDNYSGIVSRDGWGNRPKNLCIPALGGGDIPIRDFSCQVGGDVYIHQDGSWKQVDGFTGFRLLYNQQSYSPTKYEMKALSFTIPNSSESKVVNSYRR